MFIDLLIEKTDNMRIVLKPKDIQSIEFITYGFPKIVMKLFALLSQQPVEVIAMKKAE